MGKVKTQTPLEMAKEKTGRLSSMLTEVVDSVRALQEEKKRLAEQVDALLRDAAPDALGHAGKLSAQVETVDVDIARRSAMREGIEASLAASDAAIGVLEQERDREILDAQGRELNEVRRILFEKLRAFAVGFAHDVGAIERDHYQHQDLREKVFGSPEGRARRELDALRGMVARLTQEMRGMPQ